MMKILIAFILTIFCAVADAQVINRITADTIKMQSKNVNGATLQILNSTKDVLGVLYNLGNGVTEFRLMPSGYDSVRINSNESQYYYWKGGVITDSVPTVLKPVLPGYMINFDSSAGIARINVDSLKLDSLLGTLSGGTLQNAFDKSVVAGDDPKINAHSTDLYIDSLANLGMYVRGADRTAYSGMSEDEVSGSVVKGGKTAYKGSYIIGDGDPTVLLFANDGTKEQRISITSSEIKISGGNPSTNVKSKVLIENIDTLSSPPTYIAAFDGDTLKKVAYLSGGSGTDTSYLTNGDSVLNIKNTDGDIQSYNFAGGAGGSGSTFNPDTLEAAIALKLNIADTAAMQALYAAQINRNTDSLGLKKRHKDSVNIATSDYTTLYKNSQNAKYADTASGYTGDLYMAVYSSSNTYLWSPFLQYASTWSNNYDGFDSPEFNLSAYYNTMYRTENPSQLISINKRGGFPNKPDTVFYKLRTAAFGTGTFYIKPYSRLISSRPYPNQRFVLHDNYNNTDTDISSMFQTFYGASTSGTDQTAAGAASPGYSFTTNSSIAGTTGNRFYMLVYPAVSVIATPYQIALAGGTSGSGVTSITAGYGTTGGTITTTGTIAADTTVLESQARAVNRAALKMNIAPIIQTITSGTAATVTDSTTWFIINPVSLLSATVTLTMPAAPTNGKVIQFSFGGTLNAASAIVLNTLTFTPNTGQGIVGATSFYSLEVEDHISFRYNSSNSKWYQQ